MCCVRPTLSGMGRAVARGDCVVDALEAGDGFHGAVVRVGRPVRALIVAALHRKAERT